MSKFSYLLLSGLLLSGCFSSDDSPPPPSVSFDGTGYKPVYISPEEVSKITFVAGKALEDPGKIYLLEPYLFVNEKGRGIHIIDNTDATAPENIAFISIPGNYDMAAKGNWLYADNFSDLLAFDISDPKAVRLVKRIENAVPIRDYPQEANVFFECPDPSKGRVIAWEKVEMAEKPKCWR